MALPSNWKLVRVYGTYLRTDGSANTGTVRFDSKQSVSVTDDAGITVLVVPKRFAFELDDTGFFEGYIPTTDDPAITPTGWTYQMTEEISGGREGALQIPMAVDDINLVTWPLAVPVPVVPPTVTYLTADQIGTTVASQAQVDTVQDTATSAAALATSAAAAATTALDAAQNAGSAAEEATTTATAAAASAASAASDAETAAGDAASAAAAASAAEDAAIAAAASAATAVQPGDLGTAAAQNVEAFDAAGTAAEAVNVLSYDLASTAAGKGSAKVGFLQAGVGAIPLDVLAKLLSLEKTPEEFGAVGDGITDDTGAVQKALDSMTSGVLHLPNDYVITKVTVQNKANFVMYGSGAIHIAGTAPSTDKNGVCLAGALSKVEVRNLRIICDGVEANRHAGIFSNSGVEADGLDIHDNYVENGINGISCNANLSGYMRNVKVFKNEINGTVGVNSGYGYGIHFADGSGVRSDAEIYGNTVTNATRHSIYFAKGIGGRVRKNRIIGHRSTIASGLIRCALNNLRSVDVIIEDNILDNPTSGGINVGKSGINGSNYTVRNNTFNVSNNDPVPLIIVGSQDPTALDADINDGVTTEGAPDIVKVYGNTFNMSGAMQECIRVYCGTNVDVKDNTGHRDGLTSSVQAINIRGAGGDTYNANHAYTRNKFTLTGTASPLIRFDPGMSGTTFRVSFTGNEHPGNAMFAGVSGQDNPNFIINDQNVSGLSMVTGVFANGRHQLAYSFAYDPPSIAAGSSQAVNISVSNVKKNDLVIASFDNLGLSNFVVTGYATANNNIRAVLFNPGASAVDLTAGNVLLNITVNR